MPDEAVMTGVREYAEGNPVELETVEGRVRVRAVNQGGYDSVSIDLLDLLSWLHKNRPDLLKAAKHEGS